MKRKNHNCFVDDDEFEVAHVLKKEDLLKMVGSLTHQRELLKSEIQNVKLLCNTLKALNPELKTRKQHLSLDMTIVKARVESAEQVYLQQPLPLLRHSGQTSALVPFTVGSDVVYPILGPDLSPSLDLNVNIALNFDTTQLKRIAIAQDRKKRLQIYKVKKPKDGPSPSILSFG
ncbi:hypothetical protein PVL29_024127 [Vitis rotundifolia]|uniref:Uncharacterized protein n=1 Tax=Vitis rotundifolia TaxID=103349 RepID=A0AA38YR08_VITRO|nr:hypothetical protein PVL29_024127 [Vitis rotundifolia]